MNLFDNFNSKLQNKIFSLKSFSLMERIEKDLEGIVDNYKDQHSEILKNKRLKEIEINNLYKNQKITKEDFFKQHEKIAYEYNTLVLKDKDIIEIVNKYKSHENFENVKCKFEESLNGELPNNSININEDNFFFKFNLTEMPRYLFKDVDYETIIDNYNFNIKFMFEEDSFPNECDYITISIQPVDHVREEIVFSLDIDSESATVSKFLINSDKNKFDFQNEFELIQKEFLNTIINIDNLLELDTEEVKDLSLFRFDINFDLVDEKVYEVFKSGMQQFSTDLKVKNKKTINNKLKSNG